MAQQFFEGLQDKKQRVKALIAKAEEMDWITAQDKAMYQSKLDNDELTIGVIGQIKSGKSTFLNAFLFEDDVLPAAVTPMTAALSVITYGPEKKMVAEFYTQDEWQELLATARMSFEDTSDELLKSKVQAAKELMSKSSKLGSSLNSLLGKTQEDSFDNLVEYVGAEGKYVSITKSVTIYYPKEYLKGVKIVDTPGFNDPIVSREERTKEFLKKSDVVLLMLYAGRAFDATDRGILFKHVGDCGIGKVLIAVNKYDIPYEKGDSEDKICDYVKKEIAKASKEMGDEQLNDLLRDTAPLPLSAEMALLSHLPMSKVNSKYSFEWERYSRVYDISSQQEMHVRSYIDTVTDAMLQVIEREKETILFKKPLNAIQKKGALLATEVNDQISITEAEIAMLEMPDDQLDEMESGLARVERRLDKKINSLGIDLDVTFHEIIRRGSNMLEDAVDSACRKMNNVVDNWKRLQSADKLKIGLERELNFLTSRTLKRTCEEIERDGHLRLKNTLNDFFTEAEDLLMKLPKELDFDSRRFVKDVSQEIDLEIDKSLFQIDNEQEDVGWGDILVEAVGGFINGFFFFLPGLVGKLISHGEIANDARRHISDLQRDFDPRELLDKIISNKDAIIDRVKKRFNDDLLTPFQQKLEEVKQQGLNKQQKLEDARKHLSELKDRKEEIKKQVEIINAMK